MQAYDADDLAGKVEHRSAGVARVECGIGLKKLGRRRERILDRRVASCAHVPDGQRVAHAERSSDDEDLVADFDAIRVAERGCGNAARDVLDLEQRDVRGRIGGDDAGGDGLPIAELDGHGVGSLYDMSGRQHLSLLADQHAGAGARDPDAFCLAPARAACRLAVRTTTTALSTRLNARDTELPSSRANRVVYGNSK